MLNKRKNPAVFYIASFFLPAVLIMAALAGLKITPFGDNTMLLSDANGLYINYMGYVGRVLKGQESVLFSFEKGLGGNMMGSWGWFLLNPFFALFAMADITNYPQVLTWVSILNFCLSGLTMYILLKDLYGHKADNLIFSTAYAMNGFLVSNFFNINFFTGVPTLPLVVLGLRRILDDKNPLLYCARIRIVYQLLLRFHAVCRIFNDIPCVLRCGSRTNCQCESGCAQIRRFFSPCRYGLCSDLASGLTVYARRKT